MSRDVTAAINALTVVLALTNTSGSRRSLENAAFCNARYIHKCEDMLNHPPQTSTKTTSSLSFADESKCKRPAKIRRVRTSPVLHDHAIDPTRIRP